jgi:hypothetical protein
METKENCCSNETRTPAEKPGFFKRMFDKLDKSMKEKAEKQAEEGCCCSDEESGKGDKCC